MGEKFAGLLLPSRKLSNPGQTGVSLSINDLDAHPDIKRFLFEAADYGNLVMSEHANRSGRQRRLKFYLNPLYCPIYRIPFQRSKEPLYLIKHDELIVGIGFDPLSVRELYATSAGKIRYMLPFPPGPPNFFRNWDFLRVLENEVENRAMEEGNRWHVHMYDCPSIFDTLKAWTQNGAKTSALAPFGPKTLSLAMCVFALAAGRASLPPVHVFYTQPRRYEADYTTGIRRDAEGVPDIKAYCLRLGERDVYRL